MVVTPVHYFEWIAIRHFLFRLASCVALASIAANCLPNTKKLDRSPDLQCVYEVGVFLVAVIAFNWRAHLPGLDAEFLGFKPIESDRPLPHVRARWKRRKFRNKG